MAEKTRRIAELLLCIVPRGARLPVGAQVNVRVAFMQAGGAGAKHNRDALAAIFRNSVINLRLDLRQRRQQDLIVARAVRSEFFRDNRKLAIHASQDRLRMPLQPACARAHAGSDTASQVGCDIVKVISQGVDHADGGNVNHISHLNIEW